MNLNISDWKPFRIDSLFDIYTGGDLIMSEIEDGDIPIASNSTENNNIAAYTNIIPNRKLFDHTKSISIADRGKFWAFIQGKDFYLATRVKGLVCKDENILNQYQMAFVVSIINQESFKFSYGRNCCANLPSMEIYLPVDVDGNPDWQFMEDYMKSLHYKPLTTKNKSGQAPVLNVQDWGEFTIEKLFPVLTKGKCGDASSLIDGTEINYIGAKYNDNGVMKSCAKSENSDFISDGNCIAMIGQGQGSAGYAIYLDSDFIGATSLNLGYADWINPYTAHFVTTVLCQEYDKYSFGRSWTGDRLKGTVIKLPVDTNGNPDWQFMEDYIKALPYGDRLAG